jgi:hypothetical protein
LQPIALWGRTSSQSLRQSTRRPAGYCDAIAVRQFFAGIGKRHEAVVGAGAIDDARSGIRHGTSLRASMNPLSVGLPGREKSGATSLA